jgi:PAS domain S-box-containing protein
MPLPLPPPQVHALRRVADAAAHPGGPGLFADLVRELAAALDACMVFVAVFADDARTTVRTLAACLDGQAIDNFECCAECLDGCIPSGLSPRFEPGSVFAQAGIDSLCSLPLGDSAGEPLGLLVAMAREPIAGGDTAHTLAMLQITGARAAAEIERERTDEVLRAVALAVSAAPGGTVFDELVRLLATILHVEVAFIARYEHEKPDALRMVALCCDGKLLHDIAYPVAGTPCATVLGQHFRAYPHGLQSLFPADKEAGALCLDSYAGHPLAALDGSPLGVVSVGSRRPLVHAGRVKATLKIFAVRAAAEVERLHAGESQKRALQDMRQREEQYRAIFEGSLDGLFVWNEHLRVADVNPAGLALYGVRREDVLGKSYPRSMPADYVRDRLDMIRKALAGITTHVETSVLRPDGTRFDADLRVMPFTQGGRPHALTVVRDITDRRRADQQLRDSEEQYRAIFNASIDALVLRSADFRIVDVNATYETMSGFSRDEAIGMDRILANPPEVSAKIRALHHEALGGSRTVTLETQLLRRDGHRYELELRGVPVTHRGQPHVLYVGRDITQAKRAERALRDSEEQYRAIFNASADALVLRDAHFAAVEVNPAYTAMSGYTREEVMAADRVLTQADSALRTRHRAWHDQALAGKELRFEVTGTRKDGSTWEAEVRGTPMTYRGRPHVLYAVRDITARVAAEQRRGELERQLRQAQKMEAIGQLTGGLAHDFNNILTSVLGYLTMAQEQPAVNANAELARQLGQAQLAAERAREHVAQLLAFSRPERGERRLVPPAQLLGHALQLLRPNLPASIAVDVAGTGESDPAVPPVVADPVQFEQVLLNLCLNARDAIGAYGTIRLRIGESLLTGHCASCGA